MLFMLIIIMTMMIMMMPFMISLVPLIIIIFMISFILLSSFVRIISAIISSLLFLSVPLFFYWSLSMISSLLISCSFLIRAFSHFLHPLLILFINSMIKATFNSLAFYKLNWTASISIVPSLIYSIIFIYSQSRMTLPNQLF